MGLNSILAPVPILAGVTPEPGASLRRNVRADYIDSMDNVLRAWHRASWGMIHNHKIKITHTSR